MSVRARSATVLSHTRLGALYLALCLLLVGCNAATPSPTPAAPGLTPSPPAGSADPGTPGAPTASPDDQPTASPDPLATPSSQPTPTPQLSPHPVIPLPEREGALLIYRTLTYAHQNPADCGVRVTVCMQFVDVWVPADAAGPLPVAVMVHGRPNRPARLAPLAGTIAERGAVVFNIDYRGVRGGLPVARGWPEAPNDVACAVRYARATAPLFGGDPSTLVLVGHSFGGYVGPLVALAGDEFLDQDCLYPGESALPTGYVSINGNALIRGEPSWDVFFRGSKQERPEEWRQGDFMTHIGKNPELRARLIQERGDPVIPLIEPRTLFRALDGAGYDVTLQITEGDSHWALLDPNGNGRRVVPLILELLGLDKHPTP